MQPEDATHLLDGAGISLDGVARPHDQLGLDGRDVGGGVLDHPIVSLLRPCPSPSTAMMELTFTDGTTGISCSPRMNGCPGDMLSTADGTNPALRGARVPAEFTLQAGEGKGQGQQCPGEVGEDAPTGHEAPAMRGANEYRSSDLRQRLDEEPAAEQVASLVGQLQLVQRLVADRVPEPIPGADDLHLDQEPALAVARSAPSDGGPDPSRRGRAAPPPWSAPRAGAAPTARSGCPSRTGRTRTGSGCVSPGSAARRLYISAHRTTLEPVPCTKTTGMSPARYGVAETSGGRSRKSPLSRPRSPSVSSSKTGTPVNVSARAADGSFSRGTCSPPIETDSASQARWISSVPVSGCSCTRARRADGIRSRAVSGT